MEEDIKLHKSYFDKNEKYLPTDSDEDYSEEEQEILKEVRKGRHRQQDAKQEVLRFADSDDEEEEEDNDDVHQLMADSDIEGAEDVDDDMPDPMNWGRNKRNYYSTDFVDPDYSSYTAKEEELAKMEEEEAMLIQKRLMEHMKEEDFFLDEVVSKETAVEKLQQITNSTQDVTKIQARFDNMSEKERKKLFAQDSPEFDGLMSDVQQYTDEVAEVTMPVLEYVRAHNVPMIPALEYAELYQDTVLHYCYNVAFYLHLKANRVNIRDHKIVKYLLTLKNVLTQLQEKYENFIKPQLQDMLQRIQAGEEFELEEIKPELTTHVAKQKKKSKLSIMDEFDTEPQQKKTARSVGELAESSLDEDEDAEEEQADDEEMPEGDDEDTRRGITYQIAKNKGLMPQRKKEARNPRVKHRNKFRKALVRRKGAVRSLRKELKRYGGEISGINVRNVKSVKIK